MQVEGDLLPWFSEVPNPAFSEVPTAAGDSYRRKPP
jgi:hypothetical protein